MSKKTDETKQLAKRRPKSKRKKQERSIIPERGMIPFGMLPEFLNPFAMIERVLSLRLPPPQAIVWYCAPCGAELLPMRGMDGAQVLYCPSCKEPMQLCGRRPRQNPDGSIEVTFEPVSAKPTIDRHELPAAALQIEAKQEKK